MRAKQEKRQPYRWSIQDIKKQKWAQEKKEKKTKEREGEKVLRILYQCSPGSDSFLTPCAGTGDQQCHIQTLQPAAFQEKV